MRKPHVSLPFASPKSIKEHATVALCAAFAYSPLSIFIDLRAAVQCVDKATEHVLRFKNIKAITPSLVEHALDYICAAGCGRVMPHRAACYEDRQAFRYCSIACFEQVRLRHALLHAPCKLHTPCKPPLCSWLVSPCT